MEFKIKAGPQGHFYFPKIIRETLGTELRLILSARTGVIFPKNADLKEVLLSLQVILQILRIRIKEEILRECSKETEVRESRF